MHSFMRAKAEQKIFTLSQCKLTLNEAGDHSAMQVQTIAVLISRLFLRCGSCSTQPGKAFILTAWQLPSSFRRAVLVWCVSLSRCLFSTQLPQQGELWMCSRAMRASSSTAAQPLVSSGWYSWAECQQQSVRLTLLWLSTSPSSNHETDLPPQQDVLICPKEGAREGKSRDKESGFFCLYF